MLAFKTLCLTPRYFILVSTYNSYPDVKLNSKNIYQNYIQRLTLFLYFKYFFPKAFSMFFSSIGINLISIIIINSIGKINVINDLDKLLAPNKISNIPKYIGCLLILKGPETSK